MQLLATATDCKTADAQELCGLVRLVPFHVHESEEGLLSLGQAVNDLFDREPSDIELHRGRKQSHVELLSSDSSSFTAHVIDDSSTSAHERVRTKRTTARVVVFGSVDDLVERNILKLEPELLAPGCELRDGSELSDARSAVHRRCSSDR